MKVNDIKMALYFVRGDIAISNVGNNVIHFSEFRESFNIDKLIENYYSIIRCGYPKYYLELYVGF